MQSHEVNALPERVRRYIHDLETRCDLAGEVRDLWQAREQRDALAAVFHAKEVEFDSFGSRPFAEMWLNAAVQARERRAAVKALREAADFAWCETCTDDMRIKEWLRARADAIERGTS